MMDKITIEDVKHVAKLAELDLTEEEINKFVDQLNIVLEHAGKISEIDTSEVKPTSHAIDFKNVFRDDNVKKSVNKEDALSNSQKIVQDLFEIPLMIEE
jgi:aspartyl-tRNA(Asn)/glutamyl-tRNA(Gln) amidotransferase subunit C